MSWWTGPRRVIQPILTWKDGAVDAEKMVEELHAFGCDTILQNVGGMVAWYPSTVSFHERPPQMGGDVLDTVIRTARRLQMRVLGRFDFSGLREDAYQAHPEWFFRDAQGSPMVDKGFYVTCLSSPFLEEYILPVLREVIERYPLDGAFFNMFGFRTTDRRGVFHGPCQCRACQDKYRALMGGLCQRGRTSEKRRSLPTASFPGRLFCRPLDSWKACS